MNRILMLLTALLLTTPVFAAAPALAPQPGSTIGFTFTQMGVPVDGSFKKFGGRFALDRAQPAASSIDLTVDIASVDAGSDDATAEVIKTGWLDAVGHRQAHFVSKTVSALGGDRYQAAGTLTIKNVSREITVPFTVKDQPGGITDASGGFSLQRADYKIGEGEWSAFDVVANAVQVRFHLRLGPAAQK